MPVQIAPDGYSQTPSQTGIDALDSHWVYVTQRIIAQWPSTVIGGIVEATEWPLEKPVDNGIYLICGNSRYSRNMPSRQSSLMTYQARWAWFAIGSDLTQSEYAANRGDRYRLAAAWRSMMAYGLFPGFCQKQQYALQDNGSGQPQLITTTPYAYENVWWGRPDFAMRTDQQTGITFGYAAVPISAFDPEINS
jgi:hypothetical protein